MKSGFLLMKCGIDCVETKRIEKLLNSKSVNSVFSQQELKNIYNCAHSVERASGYFAVKEAVVKALGIGIFNGLELNQISVNYAENGAPILEKTDALKSEMAKQNLTQVEISITHTKTQATAICIMQ